MTDSLVLDVTHTSGSSPEPESPQGPTHGLGDADPARPGKAEAEVRRPPEYWLGTPDGGRVVLVGLVAWLGVAGWVVTASLLVGLLVVVLAAATLALMVLAL